jgi:hypothetical protein
MSERGGRKERKRFLPSLFLEEEVEEEGKERMVGKRVNGRRE